MQSTRNFEKTQKPVRTYNEAKRPDSKRGKDSARMEHQHARRRAAFQETREEGYRGVW